MSEETKKATENTEVRELGDNELEQATGGGAVKDQKVENAARSAELDGRTVQLPPATSETCICNHMYKYAASKNPEPHSLYKKAVRYVDVKCYRCGKHWNAILDLM